MEDLEYTYVYTNNFKQKIQRKFKIKYKSNHLITKITFEVESVDFDKAAIIFSGFNRYHEIPVVVEGKMLGIITNSQVTTKQEWDIIRASQYTGKYL